MSKWRGSKYPPEQERERKRMVKRAEEAWEHVLILKAIKAKLDLYGEDALTVAEKELVEKHRGFFFPPVVGP